MDGCFFDEGVYLMEGYINSDYHSCIRGNVGDPNKLPTVTEPASALPEEVPEIVRSAMDRGVTVDFQPTSFKVPDGCSCGCCFTIYAAGWYEILPHNSRRILCAPDGSRHNIDNRNGIIGSIEGRWNP